MNLIHFIHQHAKARPSEIAIISSEGNISWSRLDILIWSLAARLMEHGLKPGDRVAISTVHPLIHLVTSFALAKIGVAHIAVSASESDLVRNQISKKLGLRSVISDVEKVVASTPSALLLNKLVEFDISEIQKQQLTVTDDQLTWLVLQSSGTTGDPKFAELTHKVASERFKRFLRLFGCNERDIFWAASRPDFVVAKQRLTFCLMAGAALYLPVVNTISRDLVGRLNQYRVTLACGTPSHLHQLLTLGEPIPTLRAFEARSAFIREKLRLEFKSKINKNLYIVYGTNEGEALAVADPALQVQVLDTVGVATESICIEIVDDQGVKMSPLETGEVRVKGPGVVSAYVDNAEATSKSFKEGWFYPGDLGYLTQEGALVLQGRKDDMLIFDGMNIYPAEIENVLSSHPAVEEVAAFSISHERFQDVPVAAVTLNKVISEEDLIRFCREPLGIKSPKRIFVVKEFPRNQMGKILKRELPLLVTRGP